jgi:hypothetical protein
MISRNSTAPTVTISERRPAREVFRVLSAGYDGTWRPRVGLVGHPVRPPAFVITGRRGCAQG